jgi:hypothetical protein
MKKIILTAFAAVIALVSFAQTASSEKMDKMVKHSGETLDVKVLKVDEIIITYKYPGEDAEQTIGKYAVASITYGTSGRKEEISDKVEVSGKDDWEKVVILTDKSQVLGLKKGDDVRGKTAGMLSYQTAGSADKKATKKIKEAAAALGAPFVLLTSNKQAIGYNAPAQSFKDGTTYTYK